VTKKSTKEWFAGDIVVIEDARGQRRGSFTPDEFRAAMGCPKTAFLADCIKQWNAFQDQKGYEDRARLEMVTRPTRREAQQWQRGTRIYEETKRRR
jgi:hypothetical protein